MIKLCRVCHVWVQIYINVTYARLQTIAEAAALLHIPWLASLVLHPVQLEKQTHHTALSLASMQNTTCSFDLTEHGIEGLLLH